jgi:hypothetical protein
VRISPHPDCDTSGIRQHTQPVMLSYGGRSGRIILPHNAIRPNARDGNRSGAAPPRLVIPLPANDQHTSNELSVRGPSRHTTLRPRGEHASSHAAASPHYRQGIRRNRILRVTSKPCIILWRNEFKFILRRAVGPTISRSLGFQALPTSFGVVRSAPNASLLIHRMNQFRAKFIAHSGANR